MKKLSALFLGVLLVPALSFAQAATSTATSSKAELISALYSELAVLEQEIQQIITQEAQQASTTQQILAAQQSLQTQQDTFQQQTYAQLFGGTGSSTMSNMSQTQEAPACMPNPQLTFSTGISTIPIGELSDNSGSYSI